MEFSERLQELRKKKGLTQEELAQSLYVSRTAISKWESGRGYPSIDSLKAIAKFFSVSIDSLLSTDEVLTIAEKDSNQAKNDLRDLVYALLDLCALMLLFLPLFAKRGTNAVEGVSLLRLVTEGGVRSYMAIAYLALVCATSLLGVITLAMHIGKATRMCKKSIVSLSLGALSVLLFTLSLQPYAAVFSFVLLAVKAILLIKHR